ncbi:MAG: hypothetical protein P8R42_02200 [Candidatus Binatia bacterium]|nr:hypothetical protein [Candidatus Binatia bacterium]
MRRRTRAEAAEMKDGARRRTEIENGERPGLRVSVPLMPCVAYEIPCFDS